MVSNADCTEAGPEMINVFDTSMTWVRSLSPSFDVFSESTNPSTGALSASRSTC